jgi:HEPN domain-containing protein
MNELVKEWVLKAEQDFNAANLLMYAGESPIPDYVCFHCQQCAEKYLKALLLLCQSLDNEFKQLKKDLSQLERYAVVVRYPGIVIKADTAMDALKAADRVRKFVRRKLKAE